MDAKQLMSELDHKVFNTVVNIVEEERRGLITRAQAATGMRAVFDAVSGLCSQDNFDMLSAAALEYRDAKGVDVTFIKGQNGIHGSIRICGNGALLSYDQGTPMILPRNNSDEEVDLEAKDRQAAYHQALVDEATARKERGAW